MKKVFSVALVMLFLTALFSCKSHHRCAAYGKVEQQQTAKPA